MDQEAEKVNFPDFVNDMKVLEPVVYENKILIFEISHRNELMVNHKILPIKFDAFSFIFAIHGELNITIDYVPYTIEANSFCLLTEKHIINSMSVSRDFEGYQITVIHDFLRNIVKGIPPPPIGNISPRIRPVIGLVKSDFKILLNTVERIRNNILRKDHYYQQRIVENEMTNLICEIWNFVTQNTGNSHSSYSPSLYEELTAKFFGLLVKSGNREHEVAFYANALNVTPVYLSRAVKKTTGKTAIKLISDFVLIEAKVLLRKPSITIQEIADKLNFSDQASFSKFFKKHTGDSPSEYRKKII